MGTEKGNATEAPDISEKPKDSGADVVSYYKLFSFADSTDYMLMVIGTITAIGSGIGMPLQTLIFGELIDTFGSYSADNNTIVHQVSNVTFILLHTSLSHYFL